MTERECGCATEEECEAAWQRFYDSPEFQRLIDEANEDVRAGRVVDLGSFLQYAEDEPSTNG